MVNVLEASRTEVLDRPLLHSGAIVSYQLPKNTRLSSISLDDGSSLEFIQFATNLPGGVVNIFVHSNDLALSGMTIRARVEIREKRLANDRSFLYVDLYPVDMAEAPTHKLVVLSREFSRQDHWVVFDTPGSIRGFIALIEPEEKLVPPATKYRDSKVPVVSKQRRAPGSTQQSDTQLDRLLGEGWAIASEEGNYVHLEMVGKDGELKKLTHFRKK